MGVAVTGIYLALPYCLSHCHYCGNPATPYSARGAERYAHKLIADLAAARPTWAGRPIHTLYLGGGTPTLFAAPLLAAIMGAVRAHFQLAADAEITSEANPETVTPPVAETLLGLGVNRISIGAQSFSPHNLRALGRRHDPAAIHAAVAAARAAGFANLSLDLIFGLPGQTADGWKADLEQAIALAPEHVSAYILTIEEGTVLGERVAAGKASPPDEAACADLYALGADILEQAGYARYEVSNHARPGFACRHNQNYWRGGDWLGVGAGAASSLGGARSAWPAPVDGYLAAAAPDDLETLTPRQRAHDLAVFAMRTAQGADLAAIHAATGTDLEARLAPAITRLATQGLIRREGARLIPTPRGMLFADAVGAALADG